LPLLRRALAAIDILNAVGAGFAAISAALLAVMLIVEVVTTSAFAWSQPWAVEYSGYFLAFILFCGSGWALRSGDPDVAARWSFSPRPSRSASSASRPGS